MRISDLMRTVVIRTGKYNTSNLSLQTQRAAFLSDIVADLSTVGNQINSIYHPLISGLAELDSNVLEQGLSADILWSKSKATSDDSYIFWDTSLARKRTVKESFDYIGSELGRLEGLIDQSDRSTDLFDSSSLESDILENSLNIEQIAKDSFGPNYILDGDGNANLAYSLAQIVDAIGVNFSGYVPTGLTYSNTYPSLALSVLLSNIVFDTTISQDVIAGLTSHLSSIRSFIGMDTVVDTTEYTTYGPINLVVNGWNLERSIQHLDSILSTLTFEDVYAQGPNSVAGEIHLSTAKGHFKLYSPNALGVQQAWYNNNGSDVLIAEMRKSGLSIFNLPVKLYPMSSPPAISATEGCLYGRTTAGQTEMNWSNTSYEIQVTRRDKVYEYEVGKETIYPTDIQFTAPTNLATYTTSSGMIYNQLLFTNANTEYAYFVLEPPVCEDDSIPGKVRIMLYTRPGAAGAGAYQYKFFLDGNRKSMGAGSYEFIPEGQDIDPVWYTSGSQKTPPFTFPADEDKLYILAWDLTVSTSNNGILPIRISRNPADVQDTLPTDVSLLKIGITWLRE